jgi:hypothetical protein
MVVPVLLIEEAIRIETPMKEVIPEILLIPEEYFLKPFTHKYKHRCIEGNQ